MDPVGKFLIALHVLAATFWVGGMFFALFACRPAAMALEPPARLALMVGAHDRFFRWVWLFVAVLFATGGALAFGPWHITGPHVHVMMAGAVVMVGIFAYLALVAQPRLRRHVAASELPLAAAVLGGMRRLILTNFCLGLAIVAVAAAGAR